MVHVAEGSSIREIPKKVGALTLMLREGPTHNSRVTEINGPMTVNSGGVGN